MMKQYQPYIFYIIIRDLLYNFYLKYFFEIILDRSILTSPFVLAIYPNPRQELPNNDRGTKRPTMVGRLFCFIIRLGQLSLPLVAHEFMSIPGILDFSFDFSLVVVIQIRLSVSTPKVY
jgi:hypothetical protein